MFVDLCSFTRFCDTAGPAAATAELDRFRAQVRAVAVRRGVRVAKWLGDGAMLIALSPGPAVSTAVEIVDRVAASGALDARGAVCSGAALLFDGDDHIGLPVNLASRLCDVAAPGEVLAPLSDASARPDWVDAGSQRVVEVRGLDAPTVTVPLAIAT